mgnify:CR=1 FL=1
MAELNMKPLEDRIAPHLEEGQIAPTVSIVNQILKESIDNNARTFTFTDAGEKGVQVNVTYQNEDSKTTYLPSRFKSAVVSRIRMMCGLDFTQEVEESEMKIEVFFQRNKYNLLKHRYHRDANYNVSFTAASGLPLRVELNKLDLYRQDLMENVLDETEIKLYHRAQEKIEAILADKMKDHLSDYNLFILGLPIDKMKATEVHVKTLYEK